MTVSTTTVWGVVRWVYGTWLPSLSTIVNSPPFYIYLAVTCALGMAVTYWVDDLSNVKLNNTVRVTLQGIGLLLVYNSTTMTEANIVLVGVLVGQSILRPVLR